MRIMPAFLALLVFMLPSGVSAEDAAADREALLIAEMGKRVSVANSLIAMGRKDGDARMVAMGARILSGLGHNVIDPATTTAGGTPKFYDPAALMEDVKKFDGGNEVAMSFMMSPETPRYVSTCFWNYSCTSYFCGEYWDCGQGPPG